MSPNLRKVQQFIEKHRLLSQGNSVLVALSGGSDSVALLLMLKCLGYHCVAAHCNFTLRGAESDRDEAFVSDFCRQQQVALEVIHFDTRTYAANKHLSIEMAARQLRYEWFEQLYIKYGVSAVAVAHHRDDSVETFMLNLIRGTGINGLCGIRPHNGHIIRPLLCLSRLEILDYLDYCHQSYVTDSTNLQDEFTRNKIRLRLLPLMEEINPSIRASIQQTSSNISDAAMIYNQGIADGKARVMKDGHISIAALQAEPSPRALLFELLYPLGFNSSQTEDVFESLSGQSGKVFSSETYRVVKDRELLLVQSIEKDVEDPPFDLCFEELPYTSSFIIPRGTEKVCFDAEKLSGHIFLRKWRQGDKFVPFGMKGQKLISNFLTDNKLSVVQKDAQWVMCCDEKIAWVIGLRTDDRFRVSASTKWIKVVTIVKK
ncbi:MAG: tRNA lysidine(34) synthetase TilS [Bacteroidales bacterium]|nr:tRNA lysidine(34) synthetase TilS [Bacteroidales bacterium]